MDLMVLHEFSRDLIAENCLVFLYLSYGCQSQADAKTVVISVKFPRVAFDALICP